MIDAISSIASSLSSETVITKALLGMKVDQEVIAKVSALQSEIMTAQSAALSGLAERAVLLHKIEQLEISLKSKVSWEEDARRYVLTTYPTGAHVYDLREPDPLGEPKHRLCPSCFQRNKKSILQITRAVRGGEVVTCPDCKTEIELIKSSSHQVMTVPSQRSRWNGY